MQGRTQQERSQKAFTQKARRMANKLLTRFNIKSHFPVCPTCLGSKKNPALADFPCEDCTSPTGPYTYPYKDVADELKDALVELLEGAV